MKTVMSNGHKIEVMESSPTGLERVLYDGKEVSSRRAMFGATHTFNVREDNEDVSYEVDIGVGSLLPPRPYTTIRRNGKIIFTDR